MKIFFATFIQLVQTCIRWQTYQTQQSTNDNLKKILYGPIVNTSYPQTILVIAIAIPIEVQKIKEVKGEESHLL